MLDHVHMHVDVPRSLAALAYAAPFGGEAVLNEVATLRVRQILSIDIDIGEYIYTYPMWKYNIYRLQTGRPGLRGPFRW